MGVKPMKDFQNMALEVETPLQRKEALFLHKVRTSKWVVGEVDVE
eukprot:CAMPEP_0116065960 /NCGR_PEP_ID=MMETSP0322-20121206/10092_1 /TAXON_ID=163516 /ORGANISM="Leptocylindrus danicus var. apora, Strain B651" /LENGTH=44 /DNA_ID= /DNA_START= /DNA_END= /DNA_ORIENTATION=